MAPLHSTTGSAGTQPLGTGRIGRALSWLGRRRVRISFHVGAFLLLANWYLGVRPHPPGSLGDVVGLAGTGLVLLGTLLRSWASGIVHKNTKLATDGPYSLMRHPHYVGSLLMVLGFCVLLGSWVNFVVALPYLALVHAPQALAEEHSLHLTFGEAWLAYCRRTAWFWPRALPFHQRGQWTLRAWLEKLEYRAVLVAVLGWALLALLAEPL